MKKLKKMPVIGVMLIVCAATAVMLFTVVLPLYKNSRNIGEGVGTMEGKAVGLVTGSYKGFTEGDAQGKAEALTAEDTTANVVSRMHEVGNLEVLAAGIRLKNMHSVGEKYKVLYVIAGDAVFTVDMTKAKVSTTSGGKLNIVLPSPEVNFHIDEGKTEKLAEYQSPLFNGTAADGYTAYINSMTATVEEAKNAIFNYDELMKEAQDSAVKQVTMLVNAVRGNDKAIDIKFDA